MKDLLQLDVKRMKSVLVISLSTRAACKKSITTSLVWILKGVLQVKRTRTQLQRHERTTGIALEFCNESISKRRWFQIFLQFPQ